MIPRPHPPSPEAPDDLVARVLHGLRNAEPAPGFPGFEDRLLRSLAAAQTTPVRPSPVAHPLRWLAASAALTLATLAVVLAVHRPSPRDDRNAKPAAPLARAYNSPTVPDRTPSSTASLVLHRAGRLKTPRPAPHQDATDMQTVAAIEAAAPSQPPPPLLLTTEERQIQRFASRHTAFDLAALAPAAELAHDTAERQAFADFFKPDPSLISHAPSGTSAAAPPTDPSPATR